ncbi:MAG TPA: hypothetical protein VGO87_07810, partial [Acidimicrobiia bacterium]
MATAGDDSSVPDPAGAETISWMERDLASQWSVAHHVDRGRAAIVRWGFAIGTVGWICWALVT